MREMGVRGVLVNCSDYHCNQSRRPLPTRGGLCEIGCALRLAVPTVVRVSNAEAQTAAQRAAPAFRIKPRLIITGAP
jgi:hypothetical protein